MTRSSFSSLELLHHWMLVPFELMVACLSLYSAGNSSKQETVDCTAIRLVYCSQPAFKTDATASAIGIGGVFEAIHRI